MSFPRSEADPVPVEKSRPGAILGRPPAAVIRCSQRAVSHIGLPLLTALLVTLSAGAPAGAGGQQPTVEDSSSAAGLVRPTRPYPHVGGGRTVALLGTGAALQIAFRLVPITQRPISATGLDPAEILWSTDRAAVRRGSLHAESASDRTRDAAIALPLVLGLASTWRAPWPDVPLRGLVHAEAYLLSHGLTYLGKRAFGRPRPFAYLGADERVYEVSGEGTFQSMPSGHTSAAWTGAALAITEHLLSRPTARWWERAGVGLLGGAFAGGTAALRVAAGKHFPSDVVAGAGIGIATGITVPLLHRGGQPAPSTRAWLQTAGGAVAGSVLGVLVARQY